jgi:N utilization substance protein B
MLNRRQIRIKALQALYAHFQSGSLDLVSTEKVLNQNMDKLYDLYIWQLSFLVELIDFAEARMEEAQNKYLPTEEDLNPNTKFVNNRYIYKLRNNKDYNHHFNRLKINWGNEEELIRKVYNSVKSSSYFQHYMDQVEDGFAQDRDVLVEVVRRSLIDNELLRDHFGEMFFLWSEDYYMALSFVLHSLNETKATWSSEDKLFPLFKSSFDSEGRNEDEYFLQKLVRTVILKSDEYDKLITQKAQNWEFERIAIMDLLLLRMGMAEIFEFETIPLKVTLNEIIELSKHFSSPKSKVFVNGLLDRTIEEGLKTGTVAKKGRGLIGQ